MELTTRQSGTLTRGVDQMIDSVPALAEAGERSAAAIHDAVLAGGPEVRQVADVLHGTWLGHPLHPMLTDITVGAWVLGAVFDAVGEIGDDDFARTVGDRLIAIGTASAVPTALSGTADYSTVKQSSAAPAFVHAVLNSAGLGLYLLSLRDRNRGRRARGLAWSTLALGLTGASAWLGGHLVYKHRIGVNHRDEFEGPDEWTAIADEADLQPGRPTCVKHDGKAVLVHRDGDRLHAIGAVCSHAGGPLHEGEVDGHFVTCPWHHTVFDMRDGSIRHGPATQPQVAFDARLREGRVEIRRKG